MDGSFFPASNLPCLDSAPLLSQHFCKVNPVEHGQCKNRQQCIWQMVFQIIFHWFHFLPYSIPAMIHASEKSRFLWIMEPMTRPTNIPNRIHIRISLIYVLLCSSPMQPLHSAGPYHSGFLLILDDTSCYLTFMIVFFSRMEMMNAVNMSGKPLITPIINGPTRSLSA